MAAPQPKLHQGLSLPGLLSKGRQRFTRIADPRGRLNGVRHSLTDTLSAALAMFSLKYPSLLQFDHGGRADDWVRHNLRTLYGVEKAPCDTQMRSILDEVEPSAPQSAFRALHSAAQRGNVLQDYAILDGVYLLSVDGTGLFSSTLIRVVRTAVSSAPSMDQSITISCWRALLCTRIGARCCRSILSRSRALMAPLKMTASKMPLSAYSRAWPPSTPSVALWCSMDALAANGPHLQTLACYGMDFIIVAKPGSHAALFDTVHARRQQGQCAEWEECDAANGTPRGYRLTSEVGLSRTHPEIRVNVLEYWEIDAKGKRRHWSWITDLERRRDNAEALMRAGRARWKIENETFNTLKKPRLLFRAQLRPQPAVPIEHIGGPDATGIFDRSDPGTRLSALSAGARQRWRSRRSLWERFRSLFFTFYVPNWAALMYTWADLSRQRFYLPPLDTS